MKKVRFYSMGILAVLLLFVTGIILSSRDEVLLGARDGVIRLDGLNPGDLVQIQGTWTFYPDLLYDDLSGTDRGIPVTPIHLWAGNPEYGGRAYGYGTYVTTLEGLSQGKQYGIYMADQSMAYRLRANGVDILANGQVGRTPDRYEAEKYAAMGAFVGDEEGKVRLVLEIANFDNPQGGFWNLPLVGGVKDVQDHIQGLKLTEVFLFSSVLMLGFFFLVLYAGGRQDRSNIYLGFFSILVAFRTLLGGQRLFSQFFPAVPIMVQDRLLYLTGYLLLPVGLLLILSLGYRRVGRFQERVFKVFLILTVALVSFGSIEIYQGYVEVYKYLILFGGAYIAFFLFHGIRKRIAGALPVAFGVALMLLGALGELFLGQHPYVVSFATFAMIAIFVLVQVQNFNWLWSRNSRLEAEVIRDRLTGAYNRLYLEEMMAADEGGEDMGSWQVLFLDIDRFKELNDTYGHEAGDLVLKTVARRLIQAVRVTDRVFRYGGDEFLILLEDQGREGLQEMKERLRQVFRDPVAYQGQRLAVTGSLGGSTSQGGSGSLREAIRRSDEAMYEEKEMRKQQSTNREKGENADE